VRLAGVARRILDTDHCVITVLDGAREWAISASGDEVSVSPRPVPRTRMPEGVGFSVSLPLIDSDGSALGSISAWSEQPQTLSDDQRQCLTIIRDAVVSHLDSRRGDASADPTW
jgi:hypothetical protein